MHEPDFRLCPACGEELEIVACDQLLASTYLEKVELDDQGGLVSATWGLGEPEWEGAITLHYFCGSCRSELPENYQTVLDARLGHERLPQYKQLTVVYDAYVRVTARSKDEADRRLEQLASVFAVLDDVSLSVLDAFGIEDPETGEEIRQEALRLLDTQAAPSSAETEAVPAEEAIFGKVGRPAFRERKGIALWEAGFKVRNAEGEFEWIEIQARRKTAVFARDNLPSAAEVTAIGKWKHEEWTGKEGEERSREVFVVTHFRLNGEVT